MDFKFDVDDIVNSKSYNIEKIFEETAKRVYENRTKILEDFFKAYLAEHSGIKSTDEIELVQTATCDGTGISFYFRKKEEK